MTDLELVEHIRTAVSEEFNKLGIAERVKPTIDNPFKRVEQLLWNYHLFTGIIREKESQIADVLESGIPNKSKSILEYSPSGGGSSGVVLEEETVESVVSALQADIIWVQQVIKRIDLALDTVRESPDFQMMCDYYMGGYDLETLATKYCMDRKTVASRKNKLVRQIAIHLFPKETLDELVGGII